MLRLRIACQRRQGKSGTSDKTEKWERYLYSAFDEAARVAEATARALRERIREVNMLIAGGSMLVADFERGATGWSTSRTNAPDSSVSTA